MTSPSAGAAAKAHGVLSSAWLPLALRLKYCFLGADACPRGHTLLLGATAFASRVRPRLRHRGDAWPCGPAVLSEVPLARPVRPRLRHRASAGAPGSGLASGIGIGGGLRLELL